MRIEGGVGSLTLNLINSGHSTWLHLRSSTVYTINRFGQMQHFFGL